MTPNNPDQELDKMALEFAEKQLKYFPKKSPHISPEWIDRIRDIVRAYSYIGYKNGYHKAKECIKNE
jgi:hypothetical protein